MLLTAATAATPAMGQSINVDIGEPGTGPSDTYAAAGLAGNWNAIFAAQGQSDFNLTDLNGDPTTVWVNQFGGTENVSANDAATTGDDDRPSR